MTRRGDNPYAHIPVLHLIDAEDFVETWVTAPRKQWQYINYALQNRYNGGRLQGELQDERLWALSVCQLMIEKSRRETGFQSLRIRRAIPKVLEDLSDSEVTSAG